MQMNHLFCIDDQGDMMTVNQVRVLSRSFKVRVVSSESEGSSAVVLTGCNGRIQELGYLVFGEASVTWLLE